MYSHTSTPIDHHLATKQALASMTGVTCGSRPIRVAPATAKKAIALAGHGAGPASSSGTSIRPRVYHPSNNRSTYSINKPPSSSSFNRQSDNNYSQLGGLRDGGWRGRPQQHDGVRRGDRRGEGDGGDVKGELRALWGGACRALVVRAGPLVYVCICDLWVAAGRRPPAASGGWVGSMYLGLSPSLPLHFYK